VRMTVSEAVADVAIVGEMYCVHRTSYVRHRCRQRCSGPTFDFAGGHYGLRQALGPLARRAADSTGDRAVTAASLHRMALSARLRLAAVQRSVLWLN